MEPVRVDLDGLDPRPCECRRCGETAEMRFAGVCPRCRDELRATQAGAARAVDAEYVPKVNVTANAVALKDG